MSGQPKSSKESYWSFVNKKKNLQYNNQFIVVTGNSVTCTACKTELPISVGRTESSEMQLSLFRSHIRGKSHLQNVLNYIFNRACPNIQKANNPYKIRKGNIVYCKLCIRDIGGVRNNITEIITKFKNHTFDQKHQKELQKGKLLTNVQQKNISMSNCELPKSSTSNSVPFTSILCSVCESQIEVYNQDFSLSQDLHKQSEEHTSACRKKLQEVFVKYEKGYRECLLAELFHIYPELYDELLNCDLFANNNVYFLCGMCKIHIPSVGVLSVNNEIYKHLSSSNNCKSEYLSKIFYKYLNNPNDFVPETSASEGKDMSKFTADRISGLFQCLPPDFKSNKCVSSTVGESLYCTVCSCFINVLHKCQTLENLKVHLKTVHCENLLNKLFGLIPEKFQYCRQFIFYKESLIICSLCNVTNPLLNGTNPLLNIEQAANDIVGHLNSKQHQNNSKTLLMTVQPDKLPSVATDLLPDTVKNIDKLIECFLLQKPQIATLLKNNSRFLLMHNQNIECTLCKKIISVVQTNIKGIFGCIESHFKSKNHIKSLDVSLWKLVYECYAPEWVKSNEGCIQKVRDKFRCTVCSFDISGQNTENIMEQLQEHVTSEQHNLMKDFMNLSTSPK